LNKEKIMKSMKKVFGFAAAAVAVALVMAGCASAPATSSSGRLKGVPSFVNEAYSNAAEDVLVGIGPYKIGNDMSKLGSGKVIAETRARADLSRQISTIVKNMVLDYTSSSEVDPDAVISFQENVTQNLSKAELRGAKTVKMDTENGVLWVVMEYSKSAAEQEVNQAVSAAKLAVPAAIAFDAVARMETAFSKEAGGGPEPVEE
jgi:hypothetical protein